MRVLGYGWLFRDSAACVVLFLRVGGRTGHLRGRMGLGKRFGFGFSVRDGCLGMGSRTNGTFGRTNGYSECPKEFVLRTTGN